MLKLLSSFGSWDNTILKCSNESLGIHETRNYEKDWSEYKKKFHTLQAENKTSLSHQEKVTSTRSLANEISRLNGIKNIEKKSKKLNRKKASVTTIVEGQTLLELDKLYQTLKPKEWEQRRKEREQFFGEEIQVNEKLKSFLDWYYERQDQINKKMKKKLVKVLN